MPEAKPIEPNIPPTTAALSEALQLSGEILTDLELSRLPLSSIVLKAVRLSRLLNDFEYSELFLMESGGYPKNEKGVTPRAWRLAEIAGRTYQEKDKDDKVNTYAYIQSINELEETITAAHARLEAAQDPDVSISSANPNQHVFNPSGNRVERNDAAKSATNTASILAKRRAFLYGYALKKHYELKFSSIASDVFSRLREQADSALGRLLPEALEKFSAVYDNLSSTNPEDWSNAAHGCRRILQALADAIFPATEPRVLSGGKTIKLGAGNYINRLVCFAEDHSASETATTIIGSDLQFINDRLEALFAGAQKGTHATVSRVEADRIVIHTYLIVGDILGLAEPVV